MDTKRLFIGFLLNDDWKEAIRAFIDVQGSTRYRWIPEQRWHITLLFIGDFPAGHLRTLTEKLSAFYPLQKPFGIPFDTFVYAPNPKRPRMIWCKGATNPNFANLVLSTYKLIKEITDSLSVEWDNEMHDDIIPHITLTRFQPDGTPPALRMPHANTFPMPLLVREVHLFESLLRPAGPEYLVLSTFRLGK